MLDLSDKSCLTRTQTCILAKRSLPMKLPSQLLAAEVDFEEPRSLPNRGGIKF